MSKCIAIISTGGTIGSTLRSESNLQSDRNESVSVGKKPEKRLKRLIASTEHRCEIEHFHSTINKNSEDFTPIDWLSVLHSVKQANDNPSIDGIVITHGTDSMVYTISAVVAFSKLWNKPICFTGSYYPIGHENSDASLNLSAAIEFLAQSGIEKGVFLSFRSGGNSDNSHIIPGLCVKPMSFDERAFQPAYSQSAIVLRYRLIKGVVTVFGGQKPNLNGYDFIDKSFVSNLDNFPDSKSLTQVSNNSIMVKAYPGIGTLWKNMVTNNRKLIVVDLFHSGTCSSTEIDIAHIQSISNNTLILMGTLPTKNLLSTPYKSTLALAAAGAHIYKDIQAHFLYVYALMALACGKSSDEILKTLSPWELN